MLTTTTKENLKEIYEEDFLLWIEKTIKLLSDRNLEDLDYENLIEELATLGRNEIRTVESLIKQILIHLLLDQYGTDEYDRNAHHYQAEIFNFRDELKSYLDSRTLYNHAMNSLNKLYKSA